MGTHGKRDHLESFFGRRVSQLVILIPQEVPRCEFRIRFPVFVYLSTTRVLNSTLLMEKCGTLQSDFHRHQNYAVYDRCSRAVDIT